MAQAGGVDRSGQPIGIIFEKGNYAELSYGQINPSVSGRDLMGNQINDLAGRHSLPGVAFRYGLTERLSLSMMYDQAYGADILYPGAPASTVLGGTRAQLDSGAVTAILRYQFTDRWSAHAGLRASKASGHVTLSGLAYTRVPAGPGTFANISGYDVTFDEAWGHGFLIGGAYEIPDIALRVAVTYFSRVTHKLDTHEILPTSMTGAPIPITVPSVTSVDTPQAVNIDFQSGVAKDTLIFGSMRWVDWSEFQIIPDKLGKSLTELDDTTTWTLGVGRKFSDNWSGSAFVTYEGGAGRVVSPLAPTSGYRGIGVAAIYNHDNIRVTMGARYLDLGDTPIGPAGRRAGETSGNKALALGLKVGFAF